MGLTSMHNNLCVVGDDDQSIYSFRGADITNILNYEKNFPGAKVVKLEENYRSISPILELANKVIVENKNRRDKTLWSSKKSNFKPVLWAMGDTDHEAQVIIDEISQHQTKGKHLGDIAILYRSNTQNAPFEEHLRMAQIPYTIIGGQKFYDKKEVKDIMAYLAVILNPHDQMSLRRILNVPNRGIGTRTLEKYLEVVEAEKISLYAALDKYPDLDPKRKEHILKFTTLINKYKDRFSTTTLPQAISTMVEELDYYAFIAKSHDNPKQVERRKNDIMFFIESAERFEKYNGDQASLKKFLEKLMLQDSQDNPDEEEDDDVRKNEVTLMTLHSSKGLEYDTVYMIGLEEEILPHKRSVIEGGDGVAEERRLCYVGITRAQSKIYMTYCKERRVHGKDTVRFKSRFINEMEEQGFLIEQDRTTFGHMSEEEADEYKSNFFGSLMDCLD